MTYLFIVITLAVINALPLGGLMARNCPGERVDLGPVLRLGTAVVCGAPGDQNRDLRPNRLVACWSPHELIADLEQRTGVSIVHLEIGKVDLLRDTANLKIHFSADQEPGHFEELQD